MNIRSAGIPEHWRVFPDSAGVSMAAVERILDIGDRSEMAFGMFSLVLAGGRTPADVYRLLSETDVDFSNWHLFFGDERCLPKGHADTNSESANRVWLGNGQVPKEHIHRIQAELGSRKAADAYAQLIRPWQPFDLVLLGMGEDGHIASLFPGHEYPESASVVPVHNAPKPPPDRVSVGYGTFAAARHRLLLITGELKAAAVRQWLEGVDLPISQLASLALIEVFVDEAALSNL